MLRSALVLAVLLSLAALVIFWIGPRSTSASGAILGLHSWFYLGLVAGAAVALALFRSQSAMLVMRSRRQLVVWLGVLGGAVLQQVARSLGAGATSALFGALLGGLIPVIVTATVLVVSDAAAMLGSARHHNAVSPPGDAHDPAPPRVGSSDASGETSTNSARDEGEEFWESDQQ